jgi:mRNA interferase MazF
MSLPYHPQIGTIVICDFHGFIHPEMNKRRPAIIVSPRLRNRNNLCTIVPCSTNPPNQIMPYNYKLKLDEPLLPPPYNSKFQWVKADMIATVSFNRLFLPFVHKDAKGKREYVIKIIEDIDLRNIRECILHAMALSYLTGHL